MTHLLKGEAEHPEKKVSNLKPLKMPEHQHRL